MDAKTRSIVTFLASNAGCRNAATNVSGRSLFDSVLEIGVVSSGGFDRLMIWRRLRELDLCGQAIKGVWGMSWYQKAMKGVEDCEKPGGVVKQTIIPGFPN